MVYINPKWMIVEFLRHRLTDPRSRAEATNTENLTASASQTTFALTAPAGTVSCITNVDVDAVTKEKWKDYYVDLRNEQIVFFTAMAGGEAVDVTYKHGTSNWIYGDKPNDKLTPTAFPRMNVFIPTGTGRRLGQFEAPVEHAPQFQTDIWTKSKADDQIFTIDSLKYTGAELAEYFGYEVLRAFEDNEEDLHPALYEYAPLGPPRDLPFNQELQAHHVAVLFSMNGIELGKVE